MWRDFRGFKYVWRGEGSEGKSGVLWISEVVEVCVCREVQR
jgi:hypothetical protein